jgi:S1/P1 Nuclease
VARTHSIFTSLIVSILVFAYPIRAHAWDAHTHRLIARLAVDALPESPLKHTLEGHEADLQEDAVAPDEVLRARYGKAEAIRHYIDLEYYGADPFVALKPDLAAMELEYGADTLERSGTLPWTIEEMAQGVEQAWRKGDCAQVIVMSGYLAHYVGDATQPLHTTKYYDGYPQDRGMHARFEGAVDRSVGEVEQLARPQVHVVKIDSVWDAAISELRHSNPLVATTFDADRAARAETGAKKGDEFDRALMRREMPMVAQQVAEAASMLASIWLYEWNQAGSPATCAH